MGKIESGFLRGLKGKVGGFVFSKGEKTTIMKEYVKPTNKKTGSQVAQRIIWATVTQAAKYMLPVINHSWEGVEYGTKSRREFVHRNVAILRNFAAQDYAAQPAAADAKAFVTTKGVSQLIPNAYMFANGSLSKGKMEVINNDGDLQLTLGSGTWPVHTVTIDDTTYLGPTVGEMARVLFGLNDLDEQLSLIAIARTSEDNVYEYNDQNSLGYVIPYTAMNARRLVFDPTLDLSQVLPLFNADGTDAENQSEVIANLAETMFRNAESDQTLIEIVTSIITQATTNWLVDSAYEHGVMEFITTGVGLDQYYFYDLANDKGHVFAAGVCRSKFTDGAWRRSPSYLILATVAAADKNYGLLWSIANDAWYRTVQLSANNHFLNEGGANEVGENF